MDRVALGSGDPLAQVVRAQETVGVGVEGLDLAGAHKVGKMQWRRGGNRAEGCKDRLSQISHI